MSKLVLFWLCFILCKVPKDSIADDVSVYEMTTHDLVSRYLFYGEKIAMLISFAWRRKVCEVWI